MGSDVTVDFALFFSPEGLALAHRQEAGHWALVAEAPLDGDLAAAMAKLKSDAEARGCAKGRVLLVLPDDQMLYTSVTAPADDAELVEARIAESLDGMTPYAVSELRYDWRPVDIDRVKVAVVAQDTLDEASQFAKAHGFKPVGFAAMPPAERFPGIALFGKTRPDLPETETGMAFGADDWASQASEGDGPDSAEEHAADGAAPATAEAPNAPDQTPPAAGTDASGTTETTPADEAEAEAVGAAEPTQPDDAPPITITDPTLDRPVAPLAGDPPEAPAAEPSARPVVDTGSGEDPTPAEDMEKGAKTDRPVPVTKAGPEAGTEAAPSTDVPAEPSTATDTPPPAGETIETSDRPDAGTSAANRGKPRKSASDGKGASAANPEEGTEQGDSSVSATQTPALSFGARRGKAAKPSTDAGQIVTNRATRIGFGTAASKAEPVLHPDVAAPAPAEGRASGAGSAPAKPGNRLAAQLARVRDAARTRTATAPPAAAPEQHTPEPSLASTADTPLAGAMPKADIAEKADAAAKDRFGRFRRNRDSAGPQDNPAASAESAPASSPFDSGLLARKSVDDKGPSFKTGLILTLVLLVLLALIAIWSVLFLPESPVARLFGGGQDSETAVLSSPEAPVATAPISAPPAPDTPDPGGGDGAPEMDAPAPQNTTSAALAPEPEPQTGPSPSTPTAPVAEQQELALLPDIDADLDLPPLPPLPEANLPSLEETEAMHAAYGVWPRTPERPFFETFTITDDIYVASIDPTLSTFDALALPPAGVNPNEILRRVPPPPPFGVTPERDTRGLVVPTPEGVLTLEGAFVVLGRPPVDALPRPREIVPEAPEAPAIDAEDAILGTFQPRPRPGDLEETRERQVLGGLSMTELAGLRPAQRPLSAQEAAAGASLVPLDTAEAEPASAASTISTSGLAVAQSLLPRGRPDRIETIAAAAAQATAAPVVEARAIAPGPSIPSNADVTRAATERNAIRLRDVNLIGVTGTASNRRALVRLPSGRFVRVGVGDRLDGGRVAAIGEDSLQYVRNGRNITLDMPG